MNKSISANTLKQQAHIVNMNPAPVINTDIHGVIMFCNIAAYKIFGKNLIGMQVSEFIEGIDLYFNLETFEDREIQIESKISDKTFLFTIYKDDSNESFYIYGSNITELKSIETSLLESEEKLRCITEIASDAIVMIDENGNATYWNNAAEKIFGYSNDEIIGKDIHSLIVPESYQELANKGLSKFHKTGEGSATNQIIEITAKRKNNSEFPIELYITPFNKNGKWNAIAFVRDISERVKREKIFNKEIAQYMSMINTVPAYMYLKNSNHEYEIANNSFCELVDKPLNYIKGKTDMELFPLEKAESYHERDKIAMSENRKLINFEEALIDAEGNKKWISTTKVPVYDHDNKVCGVVGLTQDITELHLSREQLIQADKLAAIGTLAAGVAHEINNPVGFISSNLNTMQKYVNKIEKYLDNPTVLDKDYINEMILDFKDAISESSEGTERVKKIVADLKSFSRVDKAEKETVNLNEGFESTLNIVWNELKYNCKIEKDYGDIPDIFCFPNQLNQVFMNLLVNAGQAIKGDSGIIKIKTWSDKKDIFISIKDNGVGIANNNLSKIFEPFYTTKDVGKGTGLGLSLVYDIIKKHNGYINVKSEVDIGTEFIINLPLEGISNE